ncbi:hypothetical protein [Yoonia sp.]|uniref:hypothetical protein n=1 Tax=Yoonia sp. TaxID=2212373 RepID=UPI003F6B222D
MRLIAGFCCLIALAGPVFGGAWTREKGQFFIANGSNLFLSDGSELPVHYDPTVYVEYGLTPRVTFGLDYHTADRGRIHTGLVFASIPLIDTKGRDRFAASLGFGARVDRHHPVETLVRGGLAWGRGLDSGWLSVDASATYGTIDTAFRPKLDLSWGYHIADNWMASAQLQTGQGYSDDYYAKVATTVGYAVNDRYQINIGLIQAMTGDRGAALKLELWATF